MTMPRIIRNAIRCKKCGDIIESKTVHSNFAAAARALWMAVTTTFAGAEIVRIGKNYPKRKKWKAKIH